MKKILVLGAGGFIGSHLVKKLKRNNCWIRGVDLKTPEFAESAADEFVVGDLRDQKFVESVVTEDIDEIYQLAADMGGAGYIFTGEHDADIMHNSAIINLNLIDQIVNKNIKKVFYSSSACMYPRENQQDPNNPLCSEDSAYPANPDSEYGWEKLFSERVYLSLKRNYGVEVHIARYHNIFGPEGTWAGGREKAPAAMCRKVAEAEDGTEIEVWGDGKQTRSFLYIDECVEATIALMNSSFSGPVNIGSEEMVTINDLANLAIKISGKNLRIKNISGPVGVRGRNSDNSLIRKELGWDYAQSLEEGMKKTYAWIEKQVKEDNYKDNELEVILSLRK
jgi:nucleoside-diphosphate-sugar epimerase